MRYENRRRDPRKERSHESRSDPRRPPGQDLPHGHDRPDGGAIYLSLYLLGWKRGTVSYLVYVLIGAVGVPVFSGFTGGLGKLAGATGGYIVGFIPMAVIAGLVIDRYRNRGLQLAGMIVGTAVCYAFGTAWFCFVMDSTPMAALSLCVIPFIPGDLVKMLLAMWVGPMIRRRLVQAGLYPERM